MGDFNAVRKRDERRNSIFNNKCASNFNNFISENGLREYDMKGKTFTYLKDNGKKLSKIDRFFVCQEFFSRVAGGMPSALPRFLLDHCPLFLTCSDKKFRPKPFRYFNSLLERKDFDEVVHKAIVNFTGDEEPDKALIQKLKEIRDGIKPWKRAVLAKEGETESILKEELEILEELSENRDLSEEDEWAKMECQKNLNELEGYKIKDLKQRVRAKWDLEGDENSAFIHGYIKSRRAFKNIPGLMIDDVWNPL
ncbi:uncharacterized protein LOC110901743 [Helianthus annuus]|uniref:uncharacterized protein LOC110901743 n=1 Tax=Helianthus annuus TaxID=4232 RepID=UPI000B900C72|nr:uncharacterized protein LOC110901743 [Helianthus annuus]